jgi:hypothetical protein
MDAYGLFIALVLYWKRILLVLVAIGCLIWLVSCASLQPKPTPEPTPTPSGPCYAPKETPDFEYKGVPTLPPQYLDQIIAIRDAVGGCNKQNPYAKIEDMARRLRDSGLCAAAKDEEVVIQRSDKLYDAYYVVTIPTGCFATKDRMYKGTLSFGEVK